MPSKPEKTNNITAKNAANVMNAIRTENGGDYANAVPYAISEGETLPNGNIATHADAVASLRAIGNTITTFQPIKNAFLTALWNRIAKVIITSRLYQNPLAFAKKGILEYGETIEELFVQMAQPYQFDPDEAEDIVFKRRIPDVKSAFHSLNYQKYYPTTVSNEQLRQAFLSYESLSDFINRIIEQIYTAANYDEYIVMKYMLARQVLAGNIATVKIPEVSASNARAVTTTMVGFARGLEFMSNKYNQQGVRTYTDRSSLYMILDTDLSSIFDVEVLALSFNMDKAELLGRQIYVDGFGNIDGERLAQIFKDDPYTTYTPFTSAELATLKSLRGIMFDKDYLMVYDNLNETTEIQNPLGLYWNYFYHSWKTFSTSPFANAIAFIESSANSSITSVAISPTTATIPEGGSGTFKATVTATGIASKNVIWSIEADKPTNSKIFNGVLEVAKKEDNTTLKVVATSQADESKQAKATVTIGTPTATPET